MPSPRNRTELDSVQDGDVAPEGLKDETGDLVSNMTARQLAVVAEEDGIRRDSPRDDLITD